MTHYDTCSKSEAIPLTHHTQLYLYLTNVFSVSHLTMTIKLHPLKMIIQTYITIFLHYLKEQCVQGIYQQTVNKLNITMLQSASHDAFTVCVSRWTEMASFVKDRLKCYFVINLSQICKRAAKIYSITHSLTKGTCTCRENWVSSAYCDSV